MTQILKENPTLSFDEHAKTTYVPDELRGYMDPAKNRTKWLKHQVSHTYPSAAGYNDPLTVECVIDVLMRLKHKDVIRAKYLSKFLEYTHKQVLWNPVVVGVVLSELEKLSFEQFTDPTRRPLTASRDWAGHRFRLQVTADGWTWLHRMREHAAKKVEERIKAVRAGYEPRNDTSVWSDGPTRVNEEPEE